MCEKYYISNSTVCSCKNGNYLASIIDDSEITRDEIIDAEAQLFDEETKTVTTNLNEKKQPVKHKISIFYLHFY